VADAVIHPHVDVRPRVLDRRLEQPRELLVLDAVIVERVLRRVVGDRRGRLVLEAGDVLVKPSKLQRLHVPLDVHARSDERDEQFLTQRAILRGCPWVAIDDRGVAGDYLDG
jgi:hypothetical protein